MASDETNSTPSDGTTTRRRAFSLPLPPHELTVGLRPRRSTDATEKPDPPFSSVSNSDDVLTSSSESTYDGLDSHHQTAAELNNPGFGSGGVQHNSDYAIGNPESESQSNISGINNSSNSGTPPVISNFNDPVELQAAQRRFLEMQIEENRRWCRLVSAQLRARDALERMIELVQGIPDAQVDTLELLEAAREMVRAMRDEELLH
ncbi:hypothetical protein BZA77DRAFT_354337 [Pyronema omphalodes]|nr:hypothetical protein BZA77DRAFT_354337 [Pyronema omphalodes]